MTIKWNQSFQTHQIICSENTHLKIQAINLKQFLSVAYAELIFHLSMILLDLGLPTALLFLSTILRRFYVFENSETCVRLYTLTYWLNYL